MELTPYLSFNGQCAAAFRVYAECLGGTIVATATWGESPAREQVPPEWHDKVIHTERIFNALSENGTITVPYRKTFWSSGFGMVVDRFGTPWMVNCSQAPEGVAPAQRRWCDRSPWWRPIPCTRR